MKLQITKSQIITALLVAGAGSLVSASAQTVPADPAPDYKIAAGDVLSITVMDWPADSVPQAVVAPDGTVSMPLIGQVTVAGQSVAQTTTLLTSRWRKYLVAPSVSVSLTQKHLETVVFSGAVNHSGVLEYRPGMHLMEALAEAGGLVTAGSPTTGSITTVGLQTAIADPSHVIVQHEDRTMQQLNLTHPETLAGTSADIALQPGDVIFVPQQLGKISVAGEVKDPGVIPYREDLTIFDAVADSGGFNPDTADLFNTKVTHDGKDMTVNLDPMMHHNDRTANITLDPGDSVTIPELKNKTFVFGDVARPGFYLYKPGDRVQNALSGVSGPTSQADLSKINVIRTDKVTNKQQMVQVNFNNFVLHGNVDGNPLIQPGDSLYIPDKHHTFGLQDILNAASGVSSLVYTNQVLQHP